MGQLSKASQQETVASESRDFTALRLLQFLPSSPNSQANALHGIRHHGSRLDDGRTAILRVVFRRQENPRDGGLLVY